MPIDLSADRNWSEQFSLLFRDTAEALYTPTPWD